MKKVFLVALLSFLAAVKVSAAGISVRPTKLFFKAQVNQSASQTLTVKNITTGPLIYRFYSDDLADQIIIKPEFLRLDPAESEQVVITSQLRYPGIYLTNLSVLAEAMERRDFNTIAGIKVPLEIRAESAASNWFNQYLILLGAIILFLAVVLFLVRLKFRRRRTIWQKINLLSHHQKWWQKII